MIERKKKEREREREIEREKELMYEGLHFQSASVY